MNLFTQGNPYVQPRSSWPQAPRTSRQYNVPGQQITKPIQQSPVNLSQPQPQISLPQIRNTNANSEIMTLLRQQGVQLAQKYGPSLIKEFGVPLVRNVTPQIAEKLAPPLAERVVLPMITRVGFPLAKRVGLPIIKKVGGLLLTRIGF